MHMASVHISGVVYCSPSPPPHYIIVLYVYKHAAILKPIYHSKQYRGTVPQKGYKYT